ncbi:hypothetical protein D3C71_1219920 [compost metagenome]
MAVDDTARLVLFIQHCQRVQVGLAAEGLQHGGSRCVATHSRLVVEQGAEVAGFIVQRHGSVVLSRHQGPGIPWRMFLRTAEQIALNQIDTHLGQHRQFFRQLDALGDYLRPRSLGNLQDRADEFALEGILMDAVDEMAVDLHVVGT